MKKLYIFIVLIIALPIVALNIAFPQYEWYYKITVEIETPEGVVTGSAVRRVVARRGLCTQSATGICGAAASIGEGVVVDLGKRGVLFTTTSSGSYELVFQAFPYKGGLTAEGMKYYSGLKGAKASIYDQKFAMQMVHFENANDPLSLELVYGAGQFNNETQENAFVDNFQTAFGEGVKLKNITIEMVEKQPITLGVVDKYLPVTFDAVIKHGWRELSREDRNRLVHLTSFKSGEKQ